MDVLDLTKEAAKSAETLTREKTQTLLDGYPDPSFLDWIREAAAACNRPVTRISLEPEAKVQITLLKGATLWLTPKTGDLACQDERRLPRKLKKWLGL